MKLEIKTTQDIINKTENIYAEELFDDLIENDYDNFLNVKWSPVDEQIEWLESLYENQTDFFEIQELASHNANKIKERIKQLRGEK